jgi:hypothetical protein
MKIVYDMSTVDALTIKPDTPAPDPISVAREAVLARMQGERAANEALLSNYGNLVHERAYGQGEQSGWLRAHTRPGDGEMGG